MGAPYPIYTETQLAAHNRRALADEIARAAALLAETGAHQSAIWLNDDARAWVERYPASMIKATEYARRLVPVRQQAPR